MTVCSEFSASACGGHESTCSSGTSYFWALSYGQLDRARLPESGVGMLSLLTTLRRWTRAPSHILSYMRKHSCWLLCHEFGGEPVSSSEWVKAYGLGRSGWEVFLYRTTALTSSKDTSSPVLKHIPSKPRWSYPARHPTPAYFGLFFSEHSVGDGTSYASGVEEKIHTHVPQMCLCFSSSA